MSHKIELTEFPTLTKCHPCVRCGHLPKRYEAPHKSVCDLQWRWAGCGCRHTETVALADDDTLRAAWAETNV